MKISLLRVLLYSFCFVFSFNSYGQDDSVRAQSIRSLSRIIRNSYFDRAIAHQMSDTITQRFKAGSYDSAYNNNEFFYLLTKDLRSICKDDHINVTASYEPYFTEPKNESKRPLSKRKLHKRALKFEAQRKFISRQLKREAISLGEIKMVDEHTGYLEVLDFDGDPDKYEKCTLKKAASFLSKADNLIIDLRKNGGGYIRQLAYFISYFAAVKNSYLFLYSSAFRYDSLGVEKVYTNNKKIYSDSFIARGFFQPNIFVLIDGHTFSAAEGAAYLLKKINPAIKLVGERTRGGFGTSSGVGWYEFFDALIPSGQLRDEERNMVINEEGLEPDILVPGDSAYDVALRLANHSPSINVRETNYLKKMPPQKPPAPAPFDLNRYTGNYLKVTVEKKEGDLILYYDNWAPVKLHPVETDVFSAPRLIREVRFFRTGEGVITGIRLEFSDTFKEVFLKRPVFRPESVLGHMNGK